MLILKRFCSNYQRINAIVNTKKPGDAASIRGWVQNIRRLKKYIFLDVSDGSSARKFQVTLPNNESNKKISAGCLISTKGLIQFAPNGDYELHADDISLIAEGHITEGYPFVPKQQLPPEYVREHLHLRTRVDYIAAMMRLRHRALKAIHDFMDDEDFIQINTPILTTNDCEGAGEVFTVRPESGDLLKNMSRPEVPLEQSYFDTKVFLTVSGQLHLEAASFGIGNTYTLSPAFRAENSKSPLHLAEFYMFEAELAHLDKLESLSAFIEKMLKTITERILNRSSADLEFCQRSAQGSSFELDWLQKPWRTLSFREAVNIIVQNKSSFKTEVNPSEGFSKEQELFLVKHCGAPVFVVEWPAEQKPFYMRCTDSDESLVSALDLLMPNVGELCGGSLREYDLERLSKNPDLPNNLNWYLDIRKYGGIPTGGFGMGFERYLQLLSGFKNIRDVIPFPRYPHSCKM